jgi:hypothetical protein
MPVSSIVEPLVTTTISILTNAVAPRPNPTADTIFTKNSSAHARSTESRLSRLSLTVVLSGTPAAAASQSITTSTVLVSGENGMPDCAYIVAADTGPNPVCAQDHCDCDGTIAPLLSSSVSGTWTTNCDYTVQPVTSALTRVPYVHARLIPALYSNTAWQLSSSTSRYTVCDLGSRNNGILTFSTPYTFDVRSYRARNVVIGS